MTKGKSRGTGPGVFSIKGSFGEDFAIKGSFGKAFAIREGFGEDFAKGVDETLWRLTSARRGHPLPKP